MIWGTFTDICNAYNSKMTANMETHLSRSNITVCTERITAVNLLMDELRDGFELDLAAGDEYDLDTLLLMEEQKYKHYSKVCPAGAKSMWLEYYHTVKDIRVMFEEYIENYYGGFTNECF